MREVLSRVAGAAQRRGRVVFWVALGLIPCATATLPVVRHPGYELFALLALWLGLLGITVGVHFAPADRPPGWADWAGALAVLLAASLPATALAMLTTALGSPCSPTFGLDWALPLLAPSALLAAALGLAIGRATPRPARRFGLGFAAVLASALSTTATIVFGPHVYAYNHFGGYLPGPLYDEHLEVPTALWWFRLGTLLLALALFLAARRAWRPALALALAFLGVELAGTSLGFRTTDASLAEALGGVHTSPRVELHYAAELPPDTVAQLVKDVEFRYAQLASFFGAAPPGRVVVWWYPSAARKRSLVGAAHTQFAKPWRREVHVNAAEPPHPVLKHELAHAFAAVWGTAPFGITARWAGLYPIMPVVEGVAVAADDRIDELSLHEWAAAMKRQALLPDVAHVMTPQGFYATAISRAYTVAGSFLAWVQQTHGPAAIRAVYAHGDWVQATGLALDTLTERYTQFLDGVPLDPKSVSLAFPRFQRGSVFERACVREVAELEARADASFTRAPVDALALYERAARLQPHEHDFVLSRAAVLAKLGRGTEAAALLDDALRTFADEATTWADLALARIDEALSASDDATARALLESLAARDITPGQRRGAFVRQARLDDGPDGRAALAQVFESQKADRTVELLEAAAPRAEVARYLLGRVRVARNEPALALPHLRAVLSSGLPDELRAEAFHLAVDAATAVGACDELDQLATAIPAPSKAAERRAADRLAWCRFTPAPTP